MLLELSLLDEPLRRQLSEEPVLEIVEVAVSTTPESSDARESAQGELAENSATPAGGAGAAARALGPHRAGNLGIWPGPAGLRRMRGLLACVAGRGAPSGPGVPVGAHTQP